eukprot:3326581-Karenia_brevis.AAC.1
MPRVSLAYILPCSGHRRGILHKGLFTAPRGSNLTNVIQGFSRADWYVRYRRFNSGQGATANLRP